MPLVVDLDLYPGDEGQDLIEAIKRAESACPTEVTWAVRVHEGPAHSATRVTIEGPVLSEVWTPWVAEKPGTYSRTVSRGDSGWQEKFEESLRGMLVRSK